MKLIRTYTTESGDKRDMLAVTLQDLRHMAPSRMQLTAAGLDTYAEEVKEHASDIFERERLLAPGGDQGDEDTGRAQSYAPLTYWNQSRKETQETSVGRTLVGITKLHIEQAYWALGRMQSVQGDLAALLRRLTDDAGEGDRDGVAGFLSQKDRLMEANRTSMKRAIYHAMQAAVLHELIMGVASDLEGKLVGQVMVNHVERKPVVPGDVEMARRELLMATGAWVDPAPAAEQEPAAEPAPEVAEPAPEAKAPPISRAEEEMIQAIAARARRRRQAQAA
jgi:hypothetical protein